MGADDRPVSPTSVATTGAPQAMASPTTFGNPSPKADGSVAKSNALYAAFTSPARRPGAGDTRRSARDAERVRSRARPRGQLVAIVGRPIPDADETRLGMVACEARAALRKLAWSFMGSSRATRPITKASSAMPHPPQCAARRRVGPRRVGVDAVRDDRDAIGRHAARDRVRAHGTGIGDDQVGAPRQPCLGPVGEGVQRVVPVELHAAGAQPEARAWSRAAPAAAAPQASSGSAGRRRRG